MDHDLAFKRNEILKPVTAWTNLEDMMLNERSQTEKDIYGMIHFCAVLTWVRFLEMESRMGFSGAWGLRSS